MCNTVKEENPDLSSKEILTKLGAMWKDIKDTDEVEKYNQLATNDKDRYKDEMANYVQRTASPEPTARSTVAPDAPRKRRLAFQDE